MSQRLDELEAFLDEQQEPVTDYNEGLTITQALLRERFFTFGGWKNQKKRGMLIQS